jgi:hypothetical protein
MTFQFSISQLLSYKLKTVIHITKVATLSNIGKSCERLPTPVKQETRQHPRRVESINFQNFILIRDVHVEESLYIYGSMLEQYKGNNTYKFI